MDDAALWGVATAGPTKALESGAGEFARAAWARLARLLRLHEPEDHGLASAVEQVWAGEVTGGGTGLARPPPSHRAACARADPPLVARARGRRPALPRRAQRMVCGDGLDHDDQSRNPFWWFGGHA